MKKLLLLLLSFVILAGCSSGEESIILKDKVVDFSFGFLGEADRSFATENQITLIATYSSNQKGNILESTNLEIVGNSCEIASKKPQEIQFGQQLEIIINCQDSFDEPQVEGDLSFQYLEGSTQRLTQGTFLVTVEE